METWKSRDYGFCWTDIDKRICDGIEANNEADQKQIYWMNNDSYYLKKAQSCSVTGAKLGEFWWNSNLLMLWQV
jgi:hypothetical protein